MNLTQFLLDRLDEEEVFTRGMPRRVLADIEAKRRIISLAWDKEETIEGEWGMGYDRQQMAERGQYPDILRAMASVYVDHPSFDERWLES